jgi:hypothetical protein
MWALPGAAILGNIIAYGLWYYTAPMIPEGWTLGSLARLPKSAR